jgi:hypothetical protein
LKQQAESSSAKKKRTKRKLQFEEGEKAEGLAMEDNPLNLPYSDSEHEPEHNEAQGEQQTDTVLMNTQTYLLLLLQRNKINHQ